MFFELLSKIISAFFFLALHVANKGSFPPPLSAKEERELLKKSEQGDINARNKLVEHNLRLVVHITKKYYNTSVDQDDLISIGTIGLIKGISTFKSEKGSRLATYAARCIENEILMYFRAGKKSAQDVSLFEPIDTDKDGNALTLGDIISDDSDIAEKTDTKIKIEKLNKLILSVLDKREKEIISYRYGLYGKEELTQHEIAEKMGISRSYVSRIEKAALKKLRPYF